MRCSELRSRVEAEFAPELRGRVSLHVTRHLARSRMSRGWITVDGREVAEFCDWSHCYGHLGTKPHPPRAGVLTAHGEMAAWDFKPACWALLHEGVEPALASGEPLRQALAVLHRKVGRRRLRELAAGQGLHPLVGFFVRLRLGFATTAHAALPLTDPGGEVAEGSRRFLRSASTRA